MGDTKKTHESFGLIQMSRPTGNFDNLFQSGVTTNSAISLRIYRASVSNDGTPDAGKDHVFPDGRPLVEVTLSPLQFAEHLTSMGIGEGVPCTIEFAEGKAQLPPPKEEMKVARSVNQFKEKTKDLRDFAGEADILVQEILAKGNKMKKADREKLREIFSKLTKVTRDSAPFLMDQAEGHVKRITSEAMATITDHAHHMAKQVGCSPEQLAIGIKASSQALIPAEVGEDSQALAEDAPEIPELPEPEIASKPIEEMGARDLGIMINRCIKRFLVERAKLCEDHFAKTRAAATLEVTKGYPFGGGAYGEKKKVTVIWISYHNPTVLTEDEARGYLKRLQAGEMVSPHYIGRAKHGGADKG